MKRAAIKIAMLVLSHCAFAQDPIESTQLPKTQLPDVVLASPTVASLMRFEEVPVSEYTGIPSVSIPFYSENLAPNLTLGISLSYHPSGIAIDELARQWLVPGGRWKRFKDHEGKS